MRLGSFMDDFEIAAVYAREIIDSRAKPTVEVDVITVGGGFGRAAVPAGASRGENEAVEVRDGGSRFKGFGVKKAVENVNTSIADEIVGMDSRFQREIDLKLIELDGTPNKSKLGANAILGVSLAVAKAAADTYGMPLFQYLGGFNAHVLPVPLMNVINGGKHAGNELSIQEFMIIPVGASTFKEAIQMACEVYYELKATLKEKYGVSAVNIGDEGGFAPPMKETREALSSLIDAIKKAGYTENDIVLGLDAAASSFYNKNKKLYWIDGRELNVDQLHEYYLKLVDEYPIKSIEDPFFEEDFDAFAEITKELKNRVQIVGDDLFVTNINRLKKGIEMGAANALLLKVNQIGTLTEACDAALLAFRNGYRVIVSHRSGETEDVTIADLAVALNTGQIKTGAPARGERTAKYNQLIRIEEFLGANAKYAGKLGVF
ncbi:MAG: phosphopyruvate hydratase [Thermoproteales archaeon]|nr:phosphopyruvate hydratase [Thermoproteales archaeon]